MRRAVIVDAVRSPIGRRNGILKDWHPVDLSGHVISALVERTGVDPMLIDDVIWGCVSQTGEQAGRNTYGRIFEIQAILFAKTATISVNPWTTACSPRLLGTTPSTPSLTSVSKKTTPTTPTNRRNQKKSNLEELSTNFGGKTITLNKNGQIKIE